MTGEQASGLLTGEVEVAELCGVAEAGSEPWTGEMVEADVEAAQRVKVAQHGVWEDGEVVGVDVEQRQLAVGDEQAVRQRRQMVTTQPQYPQLGQRQQRSGLHVQQTVVLTHTHTQPFYGPLGFCPGLPG